MFGLVIGCCGLFVVFFPETRSRTLCDTMGEEEHKEKAACNGVGDALDSWLISFWSAQIM